MHQMVDEMIHQRMKQNIGQIKDIPKEDKEEQKEPELMKQYDLFTREAEEVHKGMEKMLDQAGKEDDKIGEALVGSLPPRPGDYLFQVQA